jgi:biopolymer transport protein ExbD
MAIFSLRRHRVVGSPRGMMCFFYCVLLLMLYYMLAGKSRSVTAPYVQTPSVSSTSCYKENHTIIVSLDANNRVFLQADEDLQTPLICEVAKQHGVFFTDAQLHRLSEMPYLSQSIQQLPQWLTAYKQERRGLTVGILGDEELSDYLTTGLQISRQLYNKPVYFALRADKNLSAPQIQHMLQLFQRNGISHINLLLEQE